MHRVWDSDRIERAGTTEEFWLDSLADLDTAENRAAWMNGTAEDWATECLLAAREAYLIPGTDKRLKSGQKLGDEYQARHLPVVRRRLCHAALRLAMVLNGAFQDPERSSGEPAVLPQSSRREPRTWRGLLGPTRGATQS
jgi:hypothetical protein